jgi:hypothetical protein
MQAMVDVPTISPHIVSQADAHRATHTCVTATIDPTFALVSHTHKQLLPKPGHRLVFLYPLQRHFPLCY